MDFALFPSAVGYRGGSNLRLRTWFRLRLGIRLGNRLRESAIRCVLLALPFWFALGSDRLLFRDCFLLGGSDFRKLRLIRGRYDHAVCRHGNQHANNA